MEQPTLKYFQFKGLLLQKGWVAPAYVGVDDAGAIQVIDDKAPGDRVAIEDIQGYALPGFQNAHSHAFQYAMAGMAEQHPKGSSDDFWSWREAMYACALSMDPDQMKTVATMLYCEMLRKGYTHVAEFHYLHHDMKGNPYPNVAEMGIHLLEAANIAGIKITLIPVFYQKGGFGKDPQPRQRRFISKSVTEYLKLLEKSIDAVSGKSFAKIGFSVHSLRAVDLKDIIDTYKSAPAGIPFHLHTAEQLKEVEDCVAFTKQRPVEWVLNNLSVNNRFNLVHCTHMTDDEVERLAKSGAQAIVCPGTEGNLGDGIFRLTDYSRHGGKWAIGTDSHISLNPLEDLRWLDYAQRFTTHKRNTFDDGASRLMNEVTTSGRIAMGTEMKDFFEKGKPLDAVVYNAKSPLFYHAKIEKILSQIMYTADSADVLGTLVDGKWIVKNGHHKNEGPIRSDFKHVMNTIQF